MTRRYDINADSTAGTADDLRQLLTGRLLASPRLARERCQAVLAGLAGESNVAWRNYASFGLGNSDGHEYVTVSTRYGSKQVLEPIVIPESFVRYMIRSYPNQLLAWVRLNTDWLRDLSLAEVEPSEAELVAIELDDIEHRQGPRSMSDQANRRRKRLGASHYDIGE